MMVTDHGSSSRIGIVIADLALLHAMYHEHASTVHWYIPVVAELEKRVVKHSRKPRAMLAHGTQTLILSDGDVRILAHVHLKMQA
jgi:hypothetical protein